MKHTPEPWLVDPDEPTIHAIDRRVLIADCRVTQVAATRPPREPGVDDANADRIVACVNACAGIADPAALRKQRDDLLEACRKANTCASIPDYVRDVIRAAIANAEPQPKE